MRCGLVCFLFCIVCGYLFLQLGDNINSSYPDYEHELQQVSLKLVTMRRELAVLSTLVTDVRRLYLVREELRLTRHIS